jgi:hypothetical protein
MDYSCFDGRSLYIEMLTRLERSPYVMSQIQGIMTLGASKTTISTKWESIMSGSTTRPVEMYSCCASWQAFESPGVEPLYTGPNAKTFAPDYAVEKSPPSQTIKHIAALTSMVGSEARGS